MPQESPATILFDELGNPIGVIFDGVVYRLQTETTITDGYHGPVSVKPPNVAATAADPALVVALSPNNAVTIGSVNQGAPNSLSNAWPVEITDGYNILGTATNPLQVNVDGYVQTNPVVIQGTNPWIVNVGNFPVDQHVIVDGYVQTNPNVNVTNFPAQQHVIVDGYVQTNPNVNVTNFPTIQPVSGIVTVNQGNPNTLSEAWPIVLTDGYGNIQGSLANPLVVNAEVVFPSDQHVIVDGYVQTNPVVVQGTTPWIVNFASEQHVIVDGYVQTNPNVNVNNFPAQQHVIVDGYVSLAVESIEIGTVDQGKPNILANAWPVELTDGSSVLGTVAHPLQVNVDGYVQTNPVVVQGTTPWVVSFPSDQHVIVDGYVQTNPNVIVSNFPAQQHVIVDGYVQTNPNVNVNNFPVQQHVIVDGYVQTNPVVVQGTTPWAVSVSNFPIDQHVIVDGYVQTNPNVIVSGTVTANQGVPNTLANGWPVELTDGANILGTVTHPLQVNVDGYVQTNPVVFQGTNPWTINGTVNIGNFPVDQHVIVDGYVQTNPNVIVSGTVNVGNFPAQQHVIVDGYVQTNPNVIVSGTVTANQGSANNLVNGWPVKITDGNNVLGTIANPLQVNVDGYVQTNPVVIQGTNPWTVNGTVNIGNFPVDQHVIVDGYVQTNPVVIQGTNPWIVNFASEQHVIVDGYVQTNPVVVQGTNPWIVNFASEQHVIVDGYVQTNPNVNVTNFPASQAVSGTVTANQGTANSLANAWSTKITDATNGPVAVKPASTAAIATDPALVVAISPNNPISFSPQSSTTIHNNATLTSNGSTAVTGIAVKDLVLTIDIINPPTGSSPTLTYHITDTDPLATGITYTYSVNSNTFNAAGGQELQFTTFSSAVFINWTVTGAGASFTGVNTVLNYKQAGSSVGVTGNVIPTTSTLMGGSDGTNLRAISTDNGGKVHVAADGPVTPGTVAGSSILVGGQYNTTPPNVGNTQQVALQLDISGRAIVVGAVQSGSAATASSPVLVAGNDGTTVRTIATDTGGHPAVVGTGVAGTPAGGVLTVQGASGGTTLPMAPQSFTNILNGATITSSGSTTVSNIPTKELALTINLLFSPTGTTPTITFSIQDVDPLSLGSNFPGHAASSRTFNSIDMQELQFSALSSAVIINWTVTGATPSFTGVNVVLNYKYTGGSVGISGSSAPTISNLIGGTDTTNLQAIRTDTSGHLMAVGPVPSGNSIGSNNPVIVGGSNSGAVKAISTDANGNVVIAGQATTTAPTYTTGTPNPLSLNTSGGLRLDGAGPTNAAAPTSAMQIAGADATGNLQVPQVDKILGETVQQLSVAATLTSPKAAAVGLAADVTAYGSLRVQTEPAALFNDPFTGNVVDTTNRWTITTSGVGAAVTQASGNISLTASTTANAYASISSQATFSPVGLGFIWCGAVIQFEATAVTGQSKFWGLGTMPASPTVSAALQDAIGLEQDTTGTLSAVVYSAGTKIFGQALTRLNDGYFHRVAVITRPDYIIWYLEGAEIPVATTQYNTPANQALPVHMHVVNGASPSAAGNFNTSAQGVGNTALNSLAISDAVYPWRQSTVKPASTAATTADTAIVVAVSPNNPVINAATNPLGQVQNITSSLTNGITSLSVSDWQVISKLDQILLVLMDIRDALLTNDNKAKSNSQ